MQEKIKFNEYLVNGQRYSSVDPTHSPRIILSRDSRNQPIHIVANQKLPKKKYLKKINKF